MGPLQRWLAEEWDVAPLEPRTVEAEALASAEEERNLWVALQQLGAHFRPEHHWMHLVTPDLPEREPVLAVSISPELYEQVREHCQLEDFRPRISAGFAGGSAGMIVSLTLELPALTEEAELLSLRTLLDPTSDGVRSELALLAEQEQVAVHFLDAATGAPLDRWHLPIDEPIRHLLRRALFKSFGREGDTLNWPWMALISLGLTYRL